MMMDQAYRENHGNLKNTILRYLQTDRVRDRAIQADSRKSGVARGEGKKERKETKGKGEKEGELTPVWNWIGPC